MKTYFIVNTCILDSEPSLRDEQYKNGISKLIELTKDMENIQIIIVENNGAKQKYLEDYNNEVNCATQYTNNNRNIETVNIGIKELIDVIDCIRRFDIGDDDFIVKMNGRYLLNDDSAFIAALKNTVVKTKEVTATDDAITYDIVVDDMVGVIDTNDALIYTDASITTASIEAVTEEAVTEAATEAATETSTATKEVHCIIKYGSYETPLPYRTGECISAIIGMRGKYAKQINIPRMEEKVENVWAAASLAIDEQNIVMLETLGINVCPGGNDYFLV